MANTPKDDGTQRVREEVIARLESRGVRTDAADSSEDLAQLLEAVEAFEEAVERGGGDLMVDEPVAGGSTPQPDDLMFVLPRRETGESAAAYVGRIDQARAEADRRSKD